MRSVKRANTSPEIVVRKLAHALGARFRLQTRELPGTPDLLFPRRRLALFVHGCFWHRHPNCRFATMPKTNVAFWAQKYQANIERDSRKEAQLRALGWRVVVIWECETRDICALRERLILELSDSVDKC